MTRQEILKRIRYERRVKYDIMPSRPELVRPDPLRAGARTHRLPEPTKLPDIPLTKASIAPLSAGERKEYKPMNTMNVRKQPQQVSASNLLFSYLPSKYNLTHEQIVNHAANYFDKTGQNDQFRNHIAISEKWPIQAKNGVSAQDTINELRSKHNANDANIIDLILRRGSGGYQRAHTVQQQLCCDYDRSDVGSGCDVH